MDRLTVIYTQDLRGRLGWLPRLFSFLEELRGEHPGALLLDLANACVADAAHCVATQGRSMLLALDALGYHAVNTAGYLSEAARQKLVGRVTLGLVDEAHVWRYHVPPVRDEGIVVASAPLPALRLCVVARSHERTECVAGALWLAAVAADEVGIATVALAPETRLLQAEARRVPANTPPHPVIRATVELIAEEARLG